MLDFLRKLFNYDDHDYKLRYRMSIGNWDDVALTKADLQSIRLLISDQLDAVQTDIAVHRLAIGYCTNRVVPDDGKSPIRNRLSALKKKRSKLEATLRNVKATLASLP